MHITFITTEYPKLNNSYGGIAEYTYKTAAMLAERGNDVSVVFVGQVKQSYKDGNVTIHELHGPDFFQGIDGTFFQQTKRLLKVLFSALKVKREIDLIHREKPIDVVQYPNYLAQALFVTSGNSFKRICRVSSYAPLLRSTYGVRKTFVRHLEDYFEYKVIKDADRAFSPSHFMKKIYKSFENLDLDVIPTATPQATGIKKDPSTYQVVRSKISNRRYLLYFGSLSRIKGGDLLAEAFPFILNKRDDIRFVVIGNDFGIPGIGSVKEFISQKLGVNDGKVLFYNHIEKEKLNPIIENALAVLIPSRIDNLPNTCLEAISQGIPIIGSNNSSIEEMIIDGKTGIVFENSSAKSLTNAIFSLLKLSESQYQWMRNNVKLFHKKIINEDRIGLLQKYYFNSLNRDNE